VRPGFGVIPAHDSDWVPALGHRLVIVGPWVVHLATDPHPLRTIHVPGAWARYQGMAKSLRKPATVEEVAQAA
jgi:hypothetical protein